MEMQWEEFEPGPVEQNTDRIHASINRRGNIYLNRRAFKAIGEPELAVLLYDRRRSTIGITRAPASRRNAYRLKRKNSNGSASRVIYAANFCRHYGIDPEETLAFLAAEVDKNGVLILNLNEVAPVRRV